MDPQQQLRYSRYLDFLFKRALRGPIRLGPWQQYSSQAWRRYRRTAEREFFDRLLPRVREDYAAAGALWSGRRQRGELEAARALSLDLAARRWDFERQAIATYLSTLPEYSPAAQLLLKALAIPTIGYVVQGGTGPSPASAALSSGLGTVSDYFALKAVADLFRGGASAAPAASSTATTASTAAAVEGFAPLVRTAI